MAKYYYLILKFKKILFQPVKQTTAIYHIVLYIFQPSCCHSVHPWKQVTYIDIFVKSHLISIRILKSAKSNGQYLQINYMKNYTLNLLQNICQLLPSMLKRKEPALEVAEDTLVSWGTVFHPFHIQPHLKKTDW